MTVVGSVSVEVRALVDRAQVERDIDTPMSRAAARVGDRFGTVLGKGIGVAMRPFVRRAGDEAGSEFGRHAREHGLSAGKTLGAGLLAGLGFSAGQGVFESAFRGLEGSLHASDELEKAVTRTHDTFGLAATSVEDFSKSATKNLLLTRTAALEAASAYGDILRGAGVGEQPAAQTSSALVGVAQNLAAIKGLDVQTVLTQLQGALQGTSRNVRSLGLDLSVGRVQAEVYALGLARPVKDAAKIQAAQNAVAAATANLVKVQHEHGVGTLAAAQAQDKLTRANGALSAAVAGKNTKLTQEQLLQARAALILRETQKSTGGAAREADTYAVATMRLHKQVGDLSATIGQGLLPYASRATSYFADLVTEFQNGTGAGGEIRTELGNIGEVAKGLGEDLRPVGSIVKWFADHPTAFKAVAESMVIYAAAAKSAAIWSALIKPPPAAGPGGGGKTGPLGIVGGGPALAVTAAATAFYELGKYDHQHPGPFYRSNDPISNFLFGKREKPPAPTLTLTPHAVQTPDDYDAKSGRGRTAVAQSVAAAAGPAARKAAADGGAAGKYAADQFAAYQQAQRDAITKATDAARAQGEAVKTSLQTELDRLKESQSALEEQGRKISDFRSQVLSQASSFSALGSLLPDNSLATGGGILSALQGRLGADRLFKSNLDLLGNRHLDKGVLEEIETLGPENGRALAAALARSSDSTLGQIGTAEKALRQQQQVLAQQATDSKFGAGALASNARAVASLLAEQKRTNKLLEAEPALIAKAVDQAQRNAHVTQTTKSRTAVPR